MKCMDCGMAVEPGRVGVDWWYCCHVEPNRLMVKDSNYITCWSCQPTHEAFHAMKEELP